MTLERDSGTALTIRRSGFLESARRRCSHDKMDEIFQAGRPVLVGLDTASTSCCCLMALF
jgi:hypothetical protein